MDSFVEKGNLYELYGALLNENQRKAYEYHIMEDMSFTEIGENLGITRQAASELFKRADKKLIKTERILGLQEKLMSLRQKASKIYELSKQDEVKKLAGEIINGIWKFIR